MRRTTRARIKERRAALVLALCALSLAPVAASAADSSESAASDPSPPQAARLVVGLRLGDAALQAGVVRDGEIILARGLDVELARILARRLRAPIDRFVLLRRTARLPVAYPTRWSLALDSTGTSRAGGGQGLSVPYLPTGAVVVLRRGATRPRGLVDLRRRVLCAVRGGGAATAISYVHPARKPFLAKDDVELLTVVRTGACDAAFVPTVEAGRFVQGHARVLGPIGGLVPDGRGLAVSVSRSSSATVADVDRVLRRLRADGTLGRLARSWLRLDPASLRVLR